jgi:hypothetical protein
MRFSLEILLLVGSAVGAPTMLELDRLTYRTKGDEGSSAFLTFFASYVIG